MLLDETVEPFSTGFDHISNCVPLYQFYRDLRAEGEAKNPVKNLLERRRRRMLNRDPCGVYAQMLRTVVERRG
jgi:hypothetical protein